MFPFIEDGRVEDLLKKPFLVRELFLQPRDDIAAHHHMDVRESLLDHFAERQAGEQLHLGPDRDPDHVRLLFRHSRHDQLVADIPIDVHLFIVQTGKDLFRDAGPIAQVAFHRIEHDRGRIVGSGNVVHHLAEAVQRPFQLLGLVEPLAPHDQLGILGPLRQIEHIHRISLLQHRFLMRFLIGQGPGLLFVLKGLELHPQPGLHPDQELHGEEVVVHLDVDVALHDRMARFAEHSRQRRQGQIGSRRHPLRWEQQHDLRLFPILFLDRSQALDLYESVTAHRPCLSP